MPAPALCRSSAGQFQGEYFARISLLMCGATVSVVAVFLFAQRYFIQGITMTGMKG
jgi:multiple sugar transport system permease protein/sn-glycerol 3-phosphate transport system permease protein